MPDEIAVGCLQLNLILKEAGLIPTGKKLNEGSNIVRAALPAESPDDDKVVFSLTDED